MKFHMEDEVVTLEWLDSHWISHVRVTELMLDTRMMVVDFTTDVMTRGVLPEGPYVKAHVRVMGGTDAQYFNLTGRVKEVWTKDGTTFRIIITGERGVSRVLAVEPVQDLNELEREVVARWCDELGEPEKAKAVREGKPGRQEDSSTGYAYYDAQVYGHRGAIK